MFLVLCDSQEIRKRRINEKKKLNEEEASQQKSTIVRVHEYLSTQQSTSKLQVQEILKFESIAWIVFC